MGALPQTPLRDIGPGNSYRNALRFLRFPISVMLYAPHCGRMTTIPNLLGDFILKPHLRFAAVLTSFWGKNSVFGENIDVRPD